MFFGLWYKSLNEPKKKADGCSVLPSALSQRKIGPEKGISPPFFLTEH